MGDLSLDLAPLNIYQRPILDDMKSGTGNLMGKGCPGCGKTHLLKAVSRELRNGMAICFNTAIRDELQASLSVPALTTHSLGRSAISDSYIGKISLDNSKYSDLVKKEIRTIDLSDLSEDYLEKDTLYSDLGKLVDLRQTTLKKDADWIIEHFNLDILPEDSVILNQHASNILRKGILEAEQQKKISFSDMIWLPVVKDMRVRQVEDLLVDEAQDFNRAQIALSLKAVKPNGRMLFVGDPDQAIMGFNGSDPDSMNLISRITKARSYPIRISYRLPLSHIEVARRIYDFIEPKDGAIEGHVEDINMTQLVKMVKPNNPKYPHKQVSLIACRKSAPLMRVCLELIKAGKPARVLGKDLASNLVQIIDKTEETFGILSFESFPASLRRYKAEKINRLKGMRGADLKIELLNDKCEAILAVYEDISVRSIPSLKAKIFSLFNQSRGAILIATIHKIKGLEVEDCYIICDPPEIELDFPNMLDWMRIQERNVHYVAVTRATRNLYFVHIN